MHAGTVASAASNTQLPATSSPPSKNYGDALTKSLLFYEGLRSGNLPQRYFAWQATRLLTGVLSGLIFSRPTRRCLLLA